MNWGMVPPGLGFTTTTHHSPRFRHPVARGASPGVRGETRREVEHRENARLARRDLRGIGTRDYRHGMRSLRPAAAVFALALFACAAPEASVAQEPTILLGRTATIHGRDGFGRTFQSPVKLKQQEIEAPGDEDEDSDDPRIRQVPAPDGPPVPP